MIKKQLPNPSFEEIFEYFQGTARRRGWPPTPNEVVRHFGISPQNAVVQCMAVRKKLDEFSETVEMARQNKMAKEVMPPMQTVSCPAPADLAKYQGINGWTDPRDRAIYNFYGALIPYHRGTVDYMFHDEMIAVLPETEKYLYGTEAAKCPEYKAGTRPFLEQVAAEVTEGCRTDREKALALVDLIAHPQQSPYRGTSMIWQHFLGGTEEEVLKKAWHMCNEISRALSFLCQVIGIPARPVFVFTDPLYFAHGHSQTEIFFDGKWNLIEQNHGYLYPMKNGYFASMVELRDNPDIINERSDAGQMLGLSSICYQAPSAIIQYRIDDVSRYSYQWQDWKRLEYRTAGADYQELYGDCDTLDDSHC